MIQELKRTSKIPSGLQNVGNSCYLSSVLQLLASSKDILIRHFERAKIGRIGQELAILLDEINNSGKRVIDPENFIKSFAIGGLSTEQQDAHEFLLKLLSLSVEDEKFNKIEGFENVNGKSKLPDDYKVFNCKNPFTGAILNELICLPCASKYRKLRRHISSIQIEPFSCLTISQFESLTVNELLYRQLCVPERINDYNNEGCGLGVINQKSPLILPELLFLHISFLTISFTKSSQQTSIQLELSGPGYRYKLLAVIVHYGSNGHSGHFVCYRRLGKRKWVECNDAKVNVISEQEVLRKSAYILLYNKE